MGAPGTVTYLVLQADPTLPPTPDPARAIAAAHTIMARSGHIRIALHTCQAEPYAAPQGMARCLSLAQVAHAGQTLLTRATAAGRWRS